jgi:addiction module HigA family antidote
MPLKPAEIATHPGEWLRKELVEEQKLSVTLVAERLGVTRQAMSNLLNGNVGLSAEMALKIEKTFGVGADPLLRMQATYDLAEARGEDPEAADPQAGGVEYVAAEALEAFQEIADEARRALHDQRTLSVDSLAPTNALTAARAAERLGQLNREIMESHALLAREPAIARVVASDENDHKQVFYIARAAAGSTVSRRYRFASYRAPIGRLAALPPGGFVEFGTGTDRKTYEVIERALFKPLEDVAGWDSVNTVFEGEETRTITVASLRRLLDDALADDSVDEIERILTEAEAEQNIKSGRTRGIITKMQLRDQAVLDAYQDEIFRLPLDSQLVILGPPGTGKTTTLSRAFLCSILTAGSCSLLRTSFGST